MRAFEKNSPPRHFEIFPPRFERHRIWPLHTYPTLMLLKQVITTVVNCGLVACTAAQSWYCLAVQNAYLISDCRKYLFHASLYEFPVPDLVQYIHIWWRNGLCRERKVSKVHTGTTIAGSGGCVCSSVDTGWYSARFESMVVFFLIQSQSVNDDWKSARQHLYTYIDQRTDRMLDFIET